MDVSPAKALRLFKVSKPTIYADMKSGKLSFSKNAKGKRKINIAELERVYPKRENSETTSPQKNVLPSSQKTFSNVELENERKSLLEKEIKLLNDQLAYKDRAIEEWKEAFNKAQNTAEKITMLLEHQTGQKDKENKIDQLITKVESMEKENKRLLEIEEERQQQEKMDARRKAQEARRAQLEEQAKRKGFFSKLFG